MTHSKFRIVFSASVGKGEDSIRVWIQGGRDHWRWPTPGIIQIIDMTLKKNGHGKWTAKIRALWMDWYFPYRGYSSMLRNTRNAFKHSRTLQIRYQVVTSVDHPKNYEIRYFYLVAIKIWTCSMESGDLALSYTAYTIYRTNFINLMVITYSSRIMHPKSNVEL